MKTNTRKFEPQVTFRVEDGEPRVEVRCISRKLRLHDFVHVPMHGGPRRFRRAVDRIRKRLRREATWWRAAAEKAVPDGEVLEVHRNEVQLRLALPPLDMPLPKFRSGSSRVRFMTRRRIYRAVARAARLREAWLSQVASQDSSETAYRLRRRTTADGPKYEVSAPHGCVVATSFELDQLIELLVQHCHFVAGKATPVAVQLDPSTWHVPRDTQRYIDQEIEF